MSGTSVEATRRRAALRGAEAVARWRLRTGAWSGRLYAVVAAVPALTALLWHGPATVPTIIGSVIFASIALALSFGVARGSRPAAAVLLALFLLDKLLAVAAYGARGIYQGLLLALVLAFGLTQGVWGAWSLRAVERERAAAETPTTPAAV